MTRTDLHRPSLLDPAEYEFLGCFYQGASEAMHGAYNIEHRDLNRAVEKAKLDGATVFHGNHEAKTTCDHCGAAFAHGVTFLHVPTNEMIAVGHICASNTVGLPSRAAKVRKTAEKAARDAAERTKLVESRKAWRDENSDVVEFLAAVDRETGHVFLADMNKSLDRWGALTDRQAAATRKFIASAKERAANPPPPEVAPTVPLVEGRREISGEIFSTKVKHSDFYGSVLKMTVKEDDGNKVWGTVPESLLAATEGETLKGRRVVFCATVERSGDDEHFGFFKRPTNARLA